ncbi:MAG TPA: phosphatase PAP2-related protein [Luteolibacter sp.]|nr:phosphatase PAP2-related protein [Luteolibacter sp.]
MTPILLKLGVIAIGLVIWFLTQKLIAGKVEAGGAINDLAHRLTARWHRYFLDHPKVTDRVLITTSLGIDVLCLSLIAMAVFGPTFKPALAIIIVFAMRQITQMCCTLPFPPDYIWRHPGFPSLLVTYGVSNDFFFSGHTALAVLAAIEISQQAPWWIGAPVIAIAAAEALIVLILRAHYTMDVLTGALAAWFAADIAGRCAPWVDGWLSA